MAITFRDEKGAPLTHEELDANFRSFFFTASFGDNNLTLQRKDGVTVNVPVGGEAFADFQANGGSIGDVFIANSQMTGSRIIIDLLQGQFYDKTKAMNSDGGGLSSDEWYIDFEPAASAPYYVHFGSNFAISSSGHLYASGAVIEGDITASGGLIGGFSVNRDAISGPLTLGTPSFFISGSAGNDDHFISASNFNIKGSGDITGSAVLFSGGTIAGWDITNSQIRKGSNIVLDATNESIYINNSTFGNEGIQLEYNSGAPRFYVGDGSSSFVKYDGTNVTVATSLLEISASNIEISSTEASMSLGNGNIELLGQDGKIIAGTTNKVTLQGNATDAFLVAGTKTGFATDDAGIIIGMDATVPTLDLTKDASNYVRFDTTSGVDIKTDTFKLDTTYFDIDTSTQRLNIFDTASAEIIRLGEISDDASDLYGLKIYNGSGTGSADTIAMFGQQGNKIGGWEITDSQIRTVPSSGFGGSYGADETGLIIHSDGKLESSNFVTNVKGWRIDTAGNGSAEFENMRIRGTLRTTVFEKESVNVVGGQLMVANATTIEPLRDADGTIIAGSSSYADTAVTFSVANVSGFAEGEIIKAKSVDATGFSVEYFYVSGSSRYSEHGNLSYNTGSIDPDGLAGEIYVERSFGGAPAASSSLTTLSSEIPDDIVTTIDVTSATGITTQNILKIGDERLKVTAINGTTFTVIRGYHDTAPNSHINGSTVFLVNTDNEFLAGLVSSAKPYNEGQVLVSTGVYNPSENISSGYILMNANPRDVSTPYMDIVERTGSGVYDLELRSRLGDLSGLSSGYLYGNNEPGFGLYTENGFFKGAITADTGSIAGILHVATVQGGLETGQKISIGRDVSGTNDGIYVNNNNYWYTDGAWKVGGATNFISLDNFTDGNLVVRTETFTLDTPNMIISSSLNNGTMTLGANADTITETAEAGIYMDGNGKFRVGTGTTGNNYIYWDGSTLNIKGAIDITGGTGVNTDELNAATSSAITTANEFTNQSTASLSGSISDVTDELDDKIFTDSTGRAVKAPTANTEGLYLASTNIGFYKDGEWKTYMDNEGDFFLTGSAGNKLAWDSSTGVLEIAGAINITGGNAATQDYVTGSIDTISGSLASSISSSNSELSSSISSSNATLGSQLNAVESLAEGKTSIFKQATAPATESRINGDMWIDSDDQNKVYIFDIGTETWVTTPDGTYDQTDLINQTSSSLSGSIALDIFTDATGKLVRTPNTSSAGLYLGDTNLGFYDDGEWKTYMANNGNFYLTGSDSNYLFWDGTSLNIAGSINITSGNAATTSSVSDAQIAAQNFAATASANAVTSGSNAADAALTSSIDYANQATASLSGSIATDISASNLNVNQISASQALINDGVTGFLDGKNSVFRQQTEPSSTGRVDGDIWIDTNSDPANKVYVWATNTFVATPDGTYDQSGLISQTSGSIAADIFTDSTGKLVKTPNLSGAGLFLGDSNLGFYGDGKWKTYMANNGNFFLTGSDGGFLKWQNGALEIKGSINIVGGNAATQDFVNTATGSISSSLSSSISDSFIANSSSAANAQQTAVLASGEAALAEQTALTASALATTATERTVDADGKITFNPTPSGTGLFMSADNLGYYDTNTWKTYMSASGDFYLAGDGNNGLSWDGSDLSIDGTIVARDGSIGGITLESNKLYNGTGTHGNSNTGFYIDSSSKFSLGDKLVWDGSNLTIEGSITVTNSNEFASQAELDAATGSFENSIAASNAATSSLANPDTYRFGPSNSFTLGAITPSAAGLYLGSNNLGYYNGGWKAYMDSSGNFLLSGNGDDGLTWNGSTLRIGNKGVGPSLAYQFSGSLNSEVFDSLITTVTTVTSPVLGVKLHTNADSWSQGLHSTAVFDRKDGGVFEWDIVVGPANARVMFGLYIENPSTFSYFNMSHAIYFDTDQDIHIYEKGSSRANLASNDWTNDPDYSENQQYRLRIQPLPTGARFEIFKNGDYTTPHLTHDTADHGVTDRYLRPGIAIYESDSAAGFIVQAMSGGSSLGQATKISGNTIQTGILESSNLSTALGSQFNLNDGTFKLGGTSSPKLNWNGSTLSIVGNITVTNPDSFATPAEKNKEDFKIILLATGSVASTNTDSVAYLASQGYTGGNGFTHFYDNNNDSDGNTNPANISGYDTQDYDLYVFDCRNWGINGSEIKLALDLFDNGKSVLIAGNDTTVANYTGSYNTEWPIKATVARSGTNWMVGPSASGKGLPASHPILAGISGNVATTTNSDTGQLITQLKAFPKGGTVVQPFSITDETTSVTNTNDVFTTPTSPTGQGITSFIATNPRGGRMVNLNTFALATTGTWASLSAQAAKNLTSFLLRTDPAIEAHYMQVTSITGEMVTTGKIQSSNLNEGSGTYTTAGTLFDLDNGSIKSKAFAIDSAGNANFRGDLSGSNITGANGTFTGTVQIGGTNLTTTNTLNSNTTANDVGLGNVDNTSDATVLASAAATAQELSPILYTFNGSDSIPTGTTENGADTFTFTSNREGTARIRLVLTDAEASGTYPNYSGIQASVNGNKLLTRLSIYDLGLTDGSDGTFFDTVQVVSGSNNIKIWSNSGDGGTTKELEVIYTQTEDITSGSAGGWTIDSSAIFSGTKDTNTFSANGITLSSANGGSIHAEQFYIDTSGNAFFRGDLNGANIDGATGTFSGTVQVGGTDLTTANTLNTEDPMSAGSVVFNPNFLQVAADGRPAGAKAVYGSDVKSNISYYGSASDGVLKLYNTSVQAVSVGFNAFPINPGAKYKFAIRIKASSTLTNALLINVAEHDSELSVNKTHLSPNSVGEYGVEDADRRITPITGNSTTGIGRLSNISVDGVTEGILWFGLLSLSTDYKVIQGIYTPNANAKYASFIIGKTALGDNVELHIDRVYVSETTEDIYTGTIAGWTIDSTAIYSGTKDTNGFAEGGGITLSSGGSIHSKNFYISQSGDAIFSGNVTGATINGGSINVPDANNPHFSVDSNGNMSAQDADISGSFSIERGTLGSWVIDPIEIGGLLRDDASQIRLDSINKEISILNAQSDGGFRKRISINSNDEFIQPSSSITNFFPDFYNGDGLFGPSPNVTSNSTNDDWVYGTYIRSGNSQAIALQETKYTINALVLPEAMEIYYDFNRSGYRLHIESTSAYTGDDWLLSNSISEPARRRLELYIEAYKTDGTHTVRKHIKTVESTSSTLIERRYNGQLYTWSYYADHPSKLTSQMGPYTYTSTYSGEAVHDPTIDIPSAGNYIFRYVHRLAVKSGKSQNRLANGTLSTATYYQTSAIYQDGDITGLDNTLGVLIESNIIEMNGAGIQIVQNEAAYTRINRLESDEYQTSLNSNYTQDLVELKGGALLIENGQLNNSSRTDTGNLAYIQKVLGPSYIQSLKVATPGDGFHDDSLASNGDNINRNGFNCDILPAKLDSSDIFHIGMYDIFDGISSSTGFASGYDRLIWDSVNAFLFNGTDGQFRDLTVHNIFTNDSDRRLKNNISGSDLGLDFINNLNPVSYRLNSDDEGNIRYGLIAQEVSESLVAVGKSVDEFGGFVRNEYYVSGSSESGSRIIKKTRKEIESNEGRYGSIDDWEYSEDTLKLGYLEFISPMIKAIQELSGKVDEMGAKIVELEAQISGSV